MGLSAKRPSEAKPAKTITEAVKESKQRRKDDGKEYKRLNAQVDPDLYNQFHALVILNGESITDLVNQWVNAYILENKKMLLSKNVAE